MKLGQIYNLDSFQSFVDSAKAPGFKDADPGIVLARQLEAIDPQIFEKKFPELSFMNSGVTVDNSGGYVEQIRSLRTRPTGQFRNALDRSSNKGKISMAGETSFIQVLSREAESDWTQTMIRQAELENRNLPSEFVGAHNMLYMRELDEIGYLGNPDLAASEGLLNYSGFTTVAATGAIGVLTAQQMYDDIAGLITSQHNAVNNTPEYMANRVDMPIYVLNTLQSTILNTAAGSSSVLRALQDNFGGVTFSGTFRADDAGGAGVSHTVAYNPNTEAMKMRVPQPLEIGEIIKISSFRFHVESMYRIAGLDVLEDTAGYILTGL